MATVTFPLSRLEGRPLLEQDDSGAIRLKSDPPRGIEALVVGRPPQDAVFLLQRLSSDSGVSHALAAMLAWEHAGGLVPSHNGALLRDLLHALSLLHAHLRQFYQQALPDYLPLSLYADYEGPVPELRRIAAGLADRPFAGWRRAAQPHPFTRAEADQLLANRIRAEKTLSLLQRMMAVLGGKFPMVMTVVPGGLTRSVTEETLFKLGRLLREVREFAASAVFEDGALVLRRYPALLRQGQGLPAFLSVGSLGDESGPGASLFPSGAFLGQKLEPLAARITESIQRAFYRVPEREPAAGVVVPEPTKEGAYSWIKAPRYHRVAVETGALARLVITHLSGSRSYSAPIVARVTQETGLAITAANTVGGRMLARLGELAMLARRCEESLNQLAPGHRTVSESSLPRGLAGEGLGRIEAPAGSVVHQLWLERGRIRNYDVIAPSTWNGAPGEGTARGSIELALNGAGIDLRTASGRLLASRIVHSFFFSATDAVQ